MKVVLSIVLALLFSAGQSYADAPLVLTVMAPEGYPKFNQNPSFLHLKEVFSGVGVELVLVERKGARELDAFERELTDIVIERGNNPRLAMLSDFEMVPEPIFKMQTYVYALKRNKNLAPVDFCRGPWSIGWRMRGVENLIADHFGCDKAAAIIWQNNLQGRARMLQADRFLVLATLSFFESVVFAEAPDAVRLEPAVTSYDGFAYISKKYKRFVPLLTQALGPPDF